MDIIRNFFSNKSFSFSRNLVQTIFFIVTLYIGSSFFLYVRALELGIEPVFSRPSGVEAFIPISSLMSLKLFLLTGNINEIHPSGLVILLIITFLSIIVKKSFCSWVCPVGFISKQLAKIHRKIFRKGFKLSRYIDLPLRFVKYILLVFLLYTVFFMMDGLAIKQFIYSPFNAVSDIKMLKFFQNISLISSVIILSIIFLSILVENFWCRYLCPYGAYLGFLSFISPFKIRRKEENCLSCGKCDKICPSKIEISKCKNIISDECFSCGRCIDTCPEKDVLNLSAPSRKIILKPIITALFVVVFFFGSTSIAKLSGKWDSSLTNSQYMGYMIKTGIIDIKNIKNPPEFIRRLDKDGKRAFMMQMMGVKK